MNTEYKTGQCAVNILFLHFSLCCYFVVAFVSLHFVFPLIRVPITNFSATPPPLPIPVNNQPSPQPLSYIFPLLGIVAVLKDWCTWFISLLIIKALSYKKKKKKKSIARGFFFFNPPPPPPAMIKNIYLFVY